ncbi:SIR2 family protein [Bacteroidota bacterium]
MKVFISHSQKDKRYAELISSALKSSGHELCFDPDNMNIGDNILAKINEGFKVAEAFIIIVSESTLQDEWLMTEFSKIVFLGFSQNSPLIISVLVDGSQVPQYLSGYPSVKLAKDGVNKINNIFTKSTDERFYVKKKEEKDKHIESLKWLIKNDRLTLVCGAGVSKGAGIPDWDDLLAELLKSAMNRNNISNEVTNPNEFTRRYKISAIVFGKFLKQILEANFFEELRNCLYSKNPITCPTIDAIVDLVRQTKRVNPIDSIITFNFDSLLEENLEKKGIKHKVIYSEGIKYSADELPIYHVHGYMPKRGEISEKNGIIFSEDAYHSQFIDPYSWSNIILLNKLSQSTCLFIGISLSDPNLRRLLDVSYRKNPNVFNHFIIEKIPKLSEKHGAVDNIASHLKEQDSNGLGLNIIWIDDYNEIPEVLNKTTN